MISKHISYDEAVYSSTAERFGISNDPSLVELENMKIVAEKCFEPIREFIKKPIRVNSFYRSKELNKKVGGSTTSHHCKGMAIDMSCFGYNAKIFNFAKNNLKFTQLIWEYGDSKEPKWVHISYDKNNLKNEVLKASYINNRTVYTSI